MVRRDPSMVSWITKLWDIQQGYKPAFLSSESEVFELGELRGEALSEAVWIGKGIKEPGLQNVSKGTAQSWGKLRCNINLKQYLCLLTCFSSKQIINGFQAVFRGPPVTPSGGFARQIHCGNPWWWLGAVGSGDYLRDKLVIWSKCLELGIEKQKWTLRCTSETAWIKGNFFLRKINKKLMVFLYGYSNISVNRIHTSQSLNYYMYLYFCGFHMLCGPLAWQ